MSGKRFLKRTLILALALALLVIALFVVLDFFGAQLQPFQYILH